MKNYIVLFFVIGTCGYIWAQIPKITGISNQYGTVDQEILITGNNFSGNINSTSVLFGSMQGIVKEATGYSISVLVPAGATTSHIQVINTLNRLSCFSNSLFNLSFSGDDFFASSFNNEISLSNANELFDLCLGDFNNDGKPDVAVTQVKNANDILIYQNTSTPGNISFTVINASTNPELNLNSISSNITCGDLNGDGLIDLVVSKEGTPRNIVFVLKNISSGGLINFDPPQPLYLHTEDIAKRVKIHDLDMDGKPEIIVTNTYLPEIHIFKNLSTSGNIQFSTDQMSFAIPGAGTTNGLLVEDLNQDGKPDLVTNPFINSDIYICRNNCTEGNINFDSPQKITVPGNLNNLAPADFNHDGKIDFVVTNTIQNEITVMINRTNNLSETFEFQSHSFPTELGPWGINTADMNGDGKLDILVAHRNSKIINVFINRSDTSSTEFTSYQISTINNTRNINGGDIDGDGKPDLVFTSFNDNTNNYSLSIIRNANCIMPAISPAGPTDICTGITKSLYATKGIGITYAWYKDNMEIKTNDEDTLIISAGGTYKVTASSESGSCVFTSNEVIVNTGTGIAPQLPVIYNDGPFCPKGAITLSTDSVSNGMYLWHGPDGFTAEEMDITIPDAKAEKAGEYTLQVIVGNCSSNIASSVVGVIVLPEFEVVSSGPGEMCAGNTVQLNVAQYSGYTYQWYLDDQQLSGQTESVISASQAGTYKAEITQSSSSCSIFTNNSIDINVLDLPVANFDNPGNVCVNEELNINNTSTYTQGSAVAYTWNFGDGSPEIFDMKPVYSYSNSGTYELKLTVNYLSGDCSDSVSKSVTVNAIPSFTIDRVPSINVCDGDTVVLSTSEEFQTYAWNTGEITRELPVTIPGDYTVTVKNTDNCAGEQTANVEFLERPEITASAEKVKVERGNAVKLEASGALYYHWTPGELLNDSTIATPEATLTDPTRFIVEGTDSYGCSDTASVFISVNEGNEINVFPRKIFSPNGDGIEDLWIIDNIDACPECSVMIFNGNGSTVYEASPYQNDWNALYKGKELPEGTYFFVLRSPGMKPKTGSINIIR